MLHLSAKRTLAPTVLLLAALALSGCSAFAGGASGEDSQPGVGVPAAPEPAFGSGGSDGGSGGGGSEGGGQAEGAGDIDPGVDRSIVTTGTMTITAADPISAAAEATEIVERLGGRVDERSEFAPRDGDAGGAMLTLRIPADQLTDTIERLRQLGEVEHVGTSASDVTREVQDLDARIEALSASVDRLVALLATATDTKVLIQLETAVSERQAELESLQAHRRGIADSVSMSTMELTLQSVEVAPVDQPETFLDGLIAGWNALISVGSATLVVLGALVPWLVFAAVLLLIVVAVLHAARRRSARRNAATAGVGDDVA
jgi:hypothetical protein